MRDCSDVEQKTIRKLTIFDDDVTAPEVVIEFEDGTVFSASFTVRAAVDAKLTIDLGGEPQVIANYGSAL